MNRREQIAESRENEIYSISLAALGMEFYSKSALHEWMVKRLGSAFAPNADERIVMVRLVKVLSIGLDTCPLREGRKNNTDTCLPRKWNTFGGFGYCKGEDQCDSFKAINAAIKGEV